MSEILAMFFLLFCHNLAVEKCHYRPIVAMCFKIYNCLLVIELFKTF